MLYFHLFLRINIKSKCRNKCITVPATLSWWQLDTEALWLRERGEGNSLCTAQGGERREMGREVQVYNKSTSSIWVRFLWWYLTYI